MSLASLRITESPLAFASFAAKHNALVDLLEATTGQNGVTVTIAERNMIIRGGGTSSGNVDLSGILANISALQNLTTGLTRQNVLYCNGGSNTTITILRS